MTPANGRAPSRALRRGNDNGFTLIEVLIAIVVVGILAAVVIIGIASLTNKGSDSACNTSKDAAKTAATVHYANTGSYPTTLESMTTATPPELDLGSDVTFAADDPGTAAVDESEMWIQHGSDWTLKMTAGAAGAPPTFACT